jgi:hypothetical protein
VTPDLRVGAVFVQTIRHFFPVLNHWLEQLPDTRDQDRILYPRRLLAWWGLLLYVLQLRSRRQLDYDLRAEGTQVLANLNRLADTQQSTRPVRSSTPRAGSRQRPGCAPSPPPLVATGWPTGTSSCNSLQLNWCNHA